MKPESFQIGVLEKALNCLFLCCARILCDKCNFPFVKLLLFRLPLSGLHGVIA